MVVKINLFHSEQCLAGKVTNIKDKDYMNIGISLKAYTFSHMMHEKLGSKSTQSLYTFVQSEVQKMTKLKWKK